MRLVQKKSRLNWVKCLSKFLENIMLQYAHNWKIHWSPETFPLIHQHLLNCCIKCPTKQNPYFEDCWSGNGLLPTGIKLLHELILTQMPIQYEAIKQLMALLGHYELSTRGAFQNTYELLNPRALKISLLYKICIFQCTGMRVFRISGFFRA